MITGIQDVYVNVADMRRSLDFYTQVLGCQVTYEDEYWSSLDAYGLKLGLHWTEGGAVPKIPFDEHGANAGATITFRSDDVTADKQKLLVHGVTVIGELDEAFGHLVVFCDPDGNVLKLMKPKY